MAKAIDNSEKNINNTMTPSDGDVLAFNVSANEYQPTAPATQATDISFDNLASGMSSTDVQAAIDELVVLANGGGGGGGGTPAVMIQNNQMDGTGLDYFIDQNTFYAVGTQIPVASDFLIGNIIVTRMKKVGDPELTIVMKIYDGEGPDDGSPFNEDNLIGTSDPIQASSLVAHPQSGSMAFNFPTAVQVHEGDNICVTIEVSDSDTWDGSNYFVVYMQTNGLAADQISGLADGDPDAWTFDDANDDILMTITT